MVNSAKMFMGTFYAVFLLGFDIQRAVSMARLELREVAGRPGRYGVEVDVDDSCVPVLYQSSIGQTLLLDQPNPYRTLVPDSICQQIESSQSEDGVESAPPIIGRDADLLLLEAAVSESRIINIVGEPGVGKTAFQNYVAQWWTASDFVERSFKFDLLKDTEIWSGSTIYGKVFDLLDDQSSVEAERDSLIHKSRYAIFIDNFAVGTDDSMKVPKSPALAHVQSLLDCLRRFGDAQKNDKCLLIISSRSELPFADELGIKVLVLKPAPIEEATTFAHQVMAQHSLSLDSSLESVQNLERFIISHHNNFLFLETMIPLLFTANKSLESALWDL